MIQNKILVHKYEHSTIHTWSDLEILIQKHLHAIWSYKEQSYKEPGLRFLKKIKNQP